MWGFIISGCVLYAGARLSQPIVPNYSYAMESGPAPANTQAIAAGPFKGLVSDYNILSVFTMYDHIKKKPLSQAQRKLAWQQLSSYLHNAQHLDPWFNDTYRLTVGLLAFQKGLALDAVQILNMGSDYIDWDWKLPFYAGFIAYDRLNDQKMAYEFMQEAISRPNVPPLAIGLTSHFLQKEKGHEASMMFLEYLLQTMPKAYHDPIKQRIERLKSQPDSNMRRQ